MILSSEFSIHVSKLKDLFGRLYIAEVFYSFMFERGWFLWMHCKKSQALNSKEEPAVIKLDGIEYIL